MKKSPLILGVSAALAFGAVATGGLLRTSETATKATGTPVTYKATSVSALSVTGTAPSGSTASISGATYNGGIQITSGSSSVFKLSGYAGYKITGITLSMKSNSKSGSGSLTAVAGTTTIASIAASAFNSSNWNGAWSTAYKDKTLTLSNDSYVIQDDETFTLTITGTANSLYVQSWTITYEEGVTKTLDSISLEGTVAKQYVGCAFDPTGLTVTALYDDASIKDVTSLVTWSISNVASTDTSVYATYQEVNSNALAFTPAERVHVSSISVTLGASTLTAFGDTTTAAATVSPDDAYDKTYAWSSSNTNVATIDENGLVTAVGNGECDIIATATDGGVTGSAHLTVYQEPAYASDKLISKDRLEFKETAYSTTAKDIVCEKITYSYVNAMVSTGQAGTIQFKKSGAGMIYNKYALPAALKTVTVVYAGSGIPAVYAATSAGGTDNAVTGTTVSKTITYDFSSYDCYFFNVTSGSATTYISSIQLSFQGDEADHLRSFVTTFNSTLDCASLNVTDEKWNACASAYDALTTREKAAVAASLSDQAGTDLEQMLPRYDYVVAKYGLSNFLSREISSGAFRFASASEQTNHAGVVAVSAALLGLGAISAFGLMARRRKQK